MKPYHPECIGQTFGKLTVLRCDPSSTTDKPRWICLCSCGKTKTVRADSARNGYAKSCGCQKHRPAVSPVARFENMIQKSDGCWEVKSSRYGKITVGTRPNMKTVSAHRFSYELYVGPIPAGLLVCHHCDNPKCVRPDHLFLGTDSDNMRDAQNKGRRPVWSGKNNPKYNGGVFMKDPVGYYAEYRRKHTETREATA